MNNKIKQLILTEDRDNIELAYELSKSINGRFYKIIDYGVNRQTKLKSDDTYIWNQSDKVRDFCLDRLAFFIFGKMYYVSPYLKLDQTTNPDQDWLLSNVADYLNLSDF